MKKKMIGTMTGALLAAMVTGMGAMAAQITADDAVNAALNKAGVTAEQVAVYKKAWEFSNGREQFDVHFLIPGQTKFEYEVDAMTGDVLTGESDLWEAEDELEYKGLTAGEAADPQEAEKLEEAVQKALQDAGVPDAVVSKKGIDFEFGKKIFDINFFVAGQTKYDYDIDAATGEILTHEMDVWEADDDLEYKGLLAPAQAQEAVTENASGEMNDARALAIALGDAGLAESDVTVTECYREMDDGIEQYNVSFRTADGMEYDYDIDAAGGAILSRDMDYDD